jgi:hypothetical protein
MGQGSSRATQAATDDAVTTFVLSAREEEIIAKALCIVFKTENVH